MKSAKHGTRLCVIKAHTPVIVADQKGSVAAGVKHFFEGLIHASEQILYDVWSKLKSSLKIGGYILRGHALQQVDGATELICKSV